MAAGSWARADEPMPVAQMSVQMREQQISANVLRKLIACVPKRAVDLVEICYQHARRTGTVARREARRSAKSGQPTM